MLTTFVAIAILAFVRNVQAHTYHTGRCQQADPMVGFDMNRFLGVWYAIHQTSTEDSCIVYKISAGARANEYTIEEEHYSPIFRDNKKSTGKITVEDPSNPGRMKISFSTNIAGSSNFVVLATDYINYAGIFICQNIALTHRRSIEVLSRSRTLDPQYQGAVYRSVNASNIIPMNMNTIRHIGCVNTIF